MKDLCCSKFNDRLWKQQRDWGPLRIDRLWNDSFGFLEFASTAAACGKPPGARRGIKKLNPVQIWSQRFLSIVLSRTILTKVKYCALWQVLIDWPNNSRAFPSTASLHTFCTCWDQTTQQCLRQPGTYLITRRWRRCSSLDQRQATPH